MSRSPLLDVPIWLEALFALLEASIQIARKNKKIVGVVIKLAHGEIPNDFATANFWRPHYPFYKSPTIFLKARAQDQELGESKKGQV